MEIKSIPEIIKEMDSLVKEEEYDEAYEFARENISLKKERIEGEYVFKNLLEELLFQVTINGEIKRKYPIMLDYSTLYSNYGYVLLHFNDYADALKSFELAYKYNPVDAKAILGLCEVFRKEGKWDEYHDLALKSIRYSYSAEDLSKSFVSLSHYYLNEYEDSNDDEDRRIASYFMRLALDYMPLQSVPPVFEEFGGAEFERYGGVEIDEIKEYLKSKGLPYGPSIEVLTICKNLGFQLDADKKVVPALFYFNIAYELTNDSAIKDVIDNLNEKVERRLNE